MVSFFNNLFLVIKQCLKTQVLLIVRFIIFKKKCIIPITVKPSRLQSLLQFVSHFVPSMFPRLVFACLFSLTFNQQVLNIIILKCESYIRSGQISVPIYEVEKRGDGILLCRSYCAITSKTAVSSTCYPLALNL